MKIDQVLEVSVSRNIKERLESIYGISGEAVERTMDCVADEVEPIIKDLKQGYNADYEKLCGEYDELIDHVERIYYMAPGDDKDEAVKEMWRSI